MKRLEHIFKICPILYVLAILMMVFPVYSSQQSIMAVTARKNAGGVEGIIGTKVDDSVDFTASLTAAYHSEFVTTTAGTIGYAHLYVVDGNSATICISAWDSSGAEIASVSGTLSDNTEGWYNVQFSSPFNITNATYEIGFQGSTPLILGRDDGNSAGLYDYSMAYNCGANITPKNHTQSTTRSISIYLNNTSGDPI
jgi:hypothetical protein